MLTIPLRQRRPHLCVSATLESKQWTPTCSVSRVGSPLIPVPIDKNEVLVYELHVTNFDTVPMTLKRVEIFANEESKEPFTTLEEDRLSAAMVRVGGAMTMSSGSSDAIQDARIIDPGGRNVVLCGSSSQVLHVTPRRITTEQSDAAADVN
jgi:hypothetical protein